MMRIEGLDLSLTATGIALVSGATETIQPHTRGDARLAEIVSRLADLWMADEPDLIALEDLLVGPRNPAAGPLGMAHGAVRLTLWQLGTPILLVAPSKLKVYAAGSGRADKARMRAALAEHSRVDDVPTMDHNQVDAAWLRHLAYDLAGTPTVAVPDRHRRALDGLTLP